MKGVLVRGIDPALEPTVVNLSAGMAGNAENSSNRGLSMPGVEALKPGQFGVVLGLDLARQLGLRLGDPVTLISPNGQVTPAGVLPRLKQMEVVGLFNSGHYEYDSALVMLHVEDAGKIFRLEGPTGVRLKIKDLHEARSVARDLAPTLSAGMAIRDWTQQNKTWFAAVQVEKRMMFIILTLIVAVAAFNLVSTLVMCHGGFHRHCGGLAFGLGDRFQHRCHRAGLGNTFPRQFFAQRHLPHQQNAKRSTNG